MEVCILGSSPVISVQTCVWELLKFKTQSDQCPNWGVEGIPTDNFEVARRPKNDKGSWQKAGKWHG